MMCFISKTTDFGSNKTVIYETNMQSSGTTAIAAV